MSTRMCIPPRLLQNKDIILAAEADIASYVQLVGSAAVIAGGLDFQSVYSELILPKYAIQLDEANLGLDDSGKKILGQYDAESDIALFDSTLGVGSGDPRRVFTCWHEIAHGVLHREWLRKQARTNPRSSVISTTEDDLSPNIRRTLERQANLYAAHAAAPTWLVRRIALDTFRLSRTIRYVGPSTYMLDVRGTCLSAHADSLNDLCRFVASKMVHRFWGLSKESLGYRIAETGVVADCTRPVGRVYRVA